MGNITLLILFILHFIITCYLLPGMCGKASFTPNGSTPHSGFMNGTVSEPGTRCGKFQLNHTPRFLSTGKVRAELLRGKRIRGKYACCAIFLCHYRDVYSLHPHKNASHISGCVLKSLRVN